MGKKLYKIGIVVAAVGLIGASGPFGAVADALDAPIQYKQTFSTTLTGSQEVPAVATTATGDATFKVKENEREIDYTLSVTGAQNVVAGHIHCGVVGTNGPVIADLFMGNIAQANGQIASGKIEESSIKSIASTCDPAITSGPQLVQAMREGKLYVNVHTTENPAGLVRGQIGTNVTSTPQPPTQAIQRSTLVATQNPDGAANDAIVGVSSNLQTAITKFKDFAGISSIQSVALSNDGTAFITYDAGNSTGGVLKIADVDVSPSYEIVTGPASGLIAPKGIELVEDRSAYIISDNGAKTVVVFSNNSSQPAFTISNLGSVTRNVWDTSYDSASDTLYVAGTDGVVMVYDDLFVDKGAFGPTKLIIPTNAAGQKISVNLHGIVYVPERNSLVLSDVGSATDATDGQLFTLSNVRESSGKKAVDSRIFGAATKLGNPVDIAYDGQQLYVAEKSNDLVLQYNDIFGRGGDSSSPATFSVKVVKPESVSLY